MVIYKRKYKSYKEYLKHQSLKMKKGQKDAFKKKDKKEGKEKREMYLVGTSERIEIFENAISYFDKFLNAGTVLCLGARAGHEVVAFRNKGYDTIGIDINPGKNNSYVIKGDFHNTPFENEKFDNIYCNCLDHVWSLEELVKEVSRILKKDGILILEIGHLQKKEDKRSMKRYIKKVSLYESFIWEDIESVEYFFKKDFKKVDSFTRDKSWQVLIMKK